jgi:hypothetical protein
MSVAALHSTPVLPRRRSAILEFCRRQLLAAVSFVVTNPTVDLRDAVFDTSIRYN